MHEVVLLLGGNLGDVGLSFKKAINMLEEKLGELTKSSSLYSSPAWGFEHENDFLNQVIVFKTVHTPHTVLAYCLETESLLGRERSFVSKSKSCKNTYEARPIDIDILFYNDKIIDSPNLQIPHPQIQNRRFTLEPLAEIMPDFMHSKLKKSCENLLKDCKDESVVRKL